VALAVETGVPAEDWLADPRAMFTAAELVQTRNDKAKQAGRRRRG
jgi:hypothetical protein